MANFVLDKAYEPDSTAFSGGVVAHHFVRQGSGNEDMLAMTTAGTLPLGVVMEDLDAEKVTARPGQVLVSVRLLGVAPVIVGTGGLTAGDQVVAAADGRGITGSTSGDFTGGVALQSGSAGHIVNVLLTPGVTIA